MPQLPKFSWAGVADAVDVLETATNERYSTKKKVTRTIKVLERQEKERARQRAREQKAAERAERDRQRAIERAKVK